MDFNSSGSLTMRYMWGPMEIVARQTSGGAVRGTWRTSLARFCADGNHSTTRGPNASYAFDIDVDLRCPVFA